jgi:hypothetical protein
MISFCRVPLCVMPPLQPLLQAIWIIISRFDGMNFLFGPVVVNAVHDTLVRE